MTKQPSEAGECSARGWLRARLSRRILTRFARSATPRSRHSAAPDRLVRHCRREGRGAVDIDGIFAVRGRKENCPKQLI